MALELLAFRIARLPRSFSSQQLLDQFGRRLRIQKTGDVIFHSVIPLRCGENIVFRNSDSHRVCWFLILCVHDLLPDHLSSAGKKPVSENRSGVRMSRLANEREPAVAIESYLVCRLLLEK